MSRIKIIEKAKHPKPSKDASMNKIVDRFKPAGGKPPLPIDKSYNRQGTK